MRRSTALAVTTWSGGVASPTERLDRPRGEWPAWVDTVLLYGPIAELEVEWRSAIGDAITAVLDRRSDSLAEKASG